MGEIKSQLELLDKWTTAWMARNGIIILRISIGIIYFWFGFLKFFPGLSPAEGLALKTKEILTFGLFPDHISLFMIATLESLIGIGLIFGIFLRLTLLLLVFQLVGTIMPVFLFPHEVFARIPYVPTIEGQYIIKNLLTISSVIIIGATVRGGGLVADPDLVRMARQRDAVRKREQNR